MNNLDLTPFAQADTDRLTADDLIGGPRTVTITDVTGAIEEGKKRAIYHFEGDSGKPFKPCKTMVRAMMSIWGKYAADHVGKSMTLYRDADVTFGALATGGVRISHMSDMAEDAVIILPTKKGKKGPIKIRPLAATQPEQPPAPKAKQTAAEWVDTHKADVTAAADFAELDAVISKGKGAVAKLDRDHRDLRDAVMDAYSAKGEALEAAVAAVAADIVQPGEATDGDFATDE